MTRRMVDSGMWSNENFAALEPMARLLQIGMINHADDQGRIKANPLYLAKEIFPYDNVAPDLISKWLEQIAANGTVILYTVESKHYAQLTKWWEYQSLQYAAPSEYPPPPKWRDRIRRTATKGLIVTFNWTLTNGAVVPDTCNRYGKPLSPQPPKVSRKLPSTSAPPANGSAHSPIDSPVDSPEPTIELNLIESNLTKEESSPIPPLPPSPEPEAPKAQDNSLEIGAVFKAWQENMPGTMTPILKDEILELTDECTARSVIHGITVSVEQNKRFFKYVASVARNHSAGRDAPSRMVVLPKLNEAERGQLITRARLARSSLQTAEKFKGYIDPAWQQAIDTAKAAGVL